MSRFRRLSRAATLLLAASSPLACRAPTLALGANSTNADQLLTSLQARFGPHDRDARLDDLRPRFTKSALIPSKLFRDKSAWTSSDNDTRTLVLSGSGTPNHYRLSIAGDAPPPQHAGDYRRVTLLTHLARDDYEWNVRDELAVGSITGNDMGRALDALFTSAEHAPDAAAHTALQHDLPRTTAALGRLFSLDTVRLTPNSAGGTDVRLAATIHADRVGPTFPHLAHYLGHYVAPTNVDLTVYDDAGHQWWTTSKHDDVISLAMRVYDGYLAPLTGLPARMPDRLHVRINASTRTFIFHVGLRNLVGNVTITRAPNDKAFVATFQNEPDWDLPLLVEQMLHSPLQRPFEGNGARLSFSVHDGDGDGAATVVVRDYDLTVRESRIMRWFGGLGDAAIEDFRTGAEVDFDRFTGEALAALHADILELAQTPGK